MSHEQARGDLAHIHHVEILTPTPRDSLDFFVDILGMEVEHRDGRSVYLRSWGEYQRYSLKLTESTTSGLGHMALRAWSPEALERRVAAIEAAGRGLGWHEGDHGHGKAYRFTDPDGHVMELIWDAERYEAPERLKPALRNVPMRNTARGAAVKRLDHVNLLARDVAACRAFATDVLGFRHYEGIRLDDGDETGAWLSRPRADLRPRRARGRGPAAPRRVLGRHPRGVPARRRPLPRLRRPDRGGAVQARGRRRLLPLRIRARRQPDRGHHRRPLPL
jgi:catechol 2,3-dioxygenase